GLKISKLEVDFEAAITAMRRTVREKLNEFKFHEALAAIWIAISFGDHFVNEKKVWEIKDDKERQQALSNLIAFLEAIASALLPFLPETSRKIEAAIEHDGDMIKVKKIEGLFP